MPQIPLIGSPDPLPAPGAPPASGAPAADLNSFGDALMTMGYREERRDLIAQREAAEVARQQALAEAHVATINAGSDIYGKTLDTFNDRYNSGQIAGATDAALSQFDSAQQDAAKAIPDIGQQVFRLHMAEMRASLQRSLGEKEMGGRNVQLGSDTATGIESDARVAMVDPSQAASLMEQRKTLIAALPIPPQEREQLLSQAGQHISYAAASTRAEKNPQGFLDSLTPENVQKDPVLSELAPANLEALRNHATMLVQQQANAAQRAQDAAEHQASTTYNQAVDLFHQGQGFDLGFVAQLKHDTDGTSLAPQADKLLQASTKVAGFGSQSLPQQRDTLAALDAQFGKNGTNPQDAQMMTSLRTIASNQQAAFKDDPLGAYTRFARGPAMPPVQITSADQALQVVSSRLPALAGVEAYGGAKGVSPLHPEEAAQLAGVLQNLPPDQAATALTSLGSQLGSADRVQALAQQLGDKDGTLGLAMTYANETTNTGRLASELLLRGARAMSDKTVAFDETKVSGWKASAAALIDGAYGNPKVEAQAVDAAVKMEAGRESLGNSPDSSMNTAVTMATHGVITHGAGKTVLPSGMGESEFNAKLATMNPADLQGQAPDSMVVAGRSMMPLETFVRQLPNATLQVTAPGMYVVRAGNTIVTNTAGTPVVLKMR